LISTVLLVSTGTFLVIIVIGGIIVYAAYGVCMEAINDLPGIERIEDYQSDYADKSIILTEDYVMQSFRYEYLQNLRNEWEWVESSNEGKPFVLLKRR
jgi:hypothetical protein